MKIYIASKFASRHRLRPMKFQLKQMGFEVLSDWMDPNPLDDTLDGDYDSIGNHPAASNAIATRDERQVGECDVFVIDTFDQSVTGGREVELGMAIALHKPIYRVGPIRNVFHAHHRIRSIPNWSVMIEQLLLLKEEYDEYKTNKS